jgi:nicotinic acid mononucleotide adenylyltransferase
VTIYDEWGRVKVDILHSLGLDIEIMWERSMKDRLTTGTEIRNLIEIGGDWQHLVPSSVRCIIEDRHLDNRIKNFKGK